MIEKLELNNGNLNGVNILYLIPSKINDVLRPTKRTRNKEHQWEFHAIAEENGIIYDFDYTTINKPSPIKGYFTEMLGKKPKNLAKIDVRVIPANDYLNTYNELIQSKFNWNYFIEAEELYPKVNLLDYLGRNNPK